MVRKAGGRVASQSLPPLCEGPSLFNKIGLGSFLVEGVLRGYTHSEWAEVQSVHLGAFSSAPRYNPLQRATNGDDNYRVRLVSRWGQLQDSSRVAGAPSPAYAERYP